MDRVLRIIRWLLASLAARDWRGLLRRVVVLSWALGRWTLVVAKHLVWRGLVLGRWALRLLGRVARRALLWSLYHPRRALASGAAATLVVAVLVVLWPERTVRVDLSKNLDCLALNIYHEARGEPVDGQVAVAQVVMNRVRDPQFPKDVCEVIRQGGEWPRERCQFSWWCDGYSDHPNDLAAWTGSKDLARLILKGALTDPTGGALWYHADYVAPDWHKEFEPRGKIGRHLFYGRKPR